MKDKNSFSKFITIISEMFEKTLSKTMTELYWKVLEPFSDTQCQKAFNEIILSSRFFPKPVDIIEAINGTQENKATLAWIKVIKAVRSIGAYQSVKFDDPVIHSVIEVMGGWPQLCSAEVGDEKWKQKEFERLYSTIANSSNHPEYLAGIIERENSVNGKIEQIKEPIVSIGFTNKKRLLKYS